MRGEQQVAIPAEAAVRPENNRQARMRPRGIIEAAASGLAISGGLCWASACLVAIFRPQQLARPYWPALSWLRTDTAGALAFVIGAAGLAVSEYLRLERRRGTRVLPAASGRRCPATESAAQAVAQTVAVMSAGLIAYLSANQVTHPATLSMQATHFARWPTEGTLRALALVACAISAALLRWVRADLTGSVGGKGT
jgi:hypothetical protein